MKKKSFLLSSLICFTGVCQSLIALPQEPSVEAGSASVRMQNARTMMIEASDKAIIHYKKFDIKKGEKVRFIQPSSSSRVLNKVKEGDPSKILGKIESNGKVFLVNPNGIYFGPNSSVRAGSFIASTLSIQNEDFIDGNFSFVLKNKHVLSEIRNDGFLSVAPEGDVVLMAPIIRNYGTIQAKAGKVVLAAGEHVTLDFQGDRLLNFSVEGDLKGSVLEHLGTIQADAGDVFMKLPTAKKAIRDIVNRDGLEKGEVFIQEEGQIKLVSTSYVLAKKVTLEAANLYVEGTIDASSVSGKGGDVHLAGTQISLKGALIDASGSLGGGEVLIGGEYQGSGDMPYASKVSMDEFSQILANAEDQGEGGNVVLWSRDSTFFNGYISAVGGMFGGDGGRVESSSQGDLTVLKASVDASSTLGSRGQWLLDPSTLEIITGSDVNPPKCVGGVVGQDTIESSSSDVILCADTINQSVSLSMQNQGVALIFTSPPGKEGELVLMDNITTKEGKIIVRNLNTTLKNSVSLDTTGGGIYSLGADIVFNDIDAEVAIYHEIQLNSGSTGRMSLQKIGKNHPLGAVELKGNGNVSLESVFTKGGPISVENPIYVTRPSVFSTTADGGAGAPIVLNTVDSLFSGTGSFTVLAGIGSISVGNMGLNTPLGNIAILSGADGITLSDIETQGGSIKIIPTILLSQPETVFKTYNRLNPLVSDGIYLKKVVASVPLVQSMDLLVGSVGDVVLGSIGSQAFELGDFSVNNNSFFSVGDVYAKSFSVAAGAGLANYNGVIRVVGTQGFRSAAGNIQLGGPILAREVFMNSLTSIQNKESEGSPITAVQGGSVFMNASFGSIGSMTSPIVVNTSGPIVVGGKTVNLAGKHSESNVTYLAKNAPCLVNFGGRKISCLIAPSLIFNLLPKQLFKDFFFSSTTLGIGYSPIVNNNSQLSPLAPIQLTNNDLPPIPSEEEET